MGGPGGGRSDGGGLLATSLVAVFAAGVLLPWGLAAAGVRWSATQSGLVAGAAIAVAIVMLGRYSRRAGGLGRRRVRIAATTLLVLVVATTLLVALRARVDQLRAELADASMTVAEDGRVLRIDGHVSDDFVATLESRLARHPGVRRIDITSGGGLVADALVAADIIRSRSLRVRIVDQCASACVLLWAASSSREMELTALVGLHRAWIDPSVPQGWEPGIREKYEGRMVAILRGAGFSDSLLDRRARTASDDMAVVDAAELLEHGVRTTVVDADGRPLTPRRVRALLDGGAAAD